MKLPVKHSVDKLEVVADAVVQLSCENGLLIQKSPLFFDKRHLCFEQPVLVMSLGRYDTAALRRFDRSCQNIGKAGQEVDVVLVIGLRYRAVDFQHAIRLSVRLNNDING